MRPREATLKRTYGVNADDYEVMAEAQGWACAVCEREDERERQDGGDFVLSVDHDHETGRVRQLLCHRCNTAIGLLRDDPKLADRIAEYLRLHGRT
jgi:hypothetical protein